MGVFNSNDIRGVFNKEWDADTAYSIGVVLGSVIDAEKIVVGRDSRTTSQTVFDSLTKGITSAGKDVYDIGLCDTPAVYFAVVNYKLDGGVMITASHNPPEYNGMKIVKSGSRPVGYSNGINKLEKLVSSEIAEDYYSDVKGKIISLDIEEDYASFYSKFSDDLGNLNIIIDCSSGTAGVFGEKIISGVSDNYRFINREPDGTFPFHGPNPMLEENLEQLKKEVLKNNADAGLCFDGDADRVIFIDEKGEMVSPDMIIGILAEYYLKENKETVIYDLRCSNGIAEHIKGCGGTALMSPVGHTGIKKMMRESGGVFGGELAGHYYFRDYFYSDSAWLTALLVLNVIKKTGKKISEIVSEIQKYSFSGEMNFRTKIRKTLFSELKEKYSAGSFTEIDGLRIDYPDWWFLVRQSTNEPLVRLVVEAENKTTMDKKIKEISKCIKGE